MRRFMDSLFNGYVTFKKNVTIIGDLTSLIFKNGVKEIVIKRTSDDKLYIQKLTNGDIISNFGYFDYETGNFVINGLVTQSGEHPTPQKGGFYFNTQTNTWYKCTNGSSWEEANI